MAAVLIFVVILLFVARRFSQYNHQPHLNAPRFSGVSALLLPPLSS
jgi:hypothetical protein